MMGRVRELDVGMGSVGWLSGSIGRPAGGGRALARSASSRRGVSPLRAAIPDARVAVVRPSLL